MDELPVAARETMGEAVGVTEEKVWGGMVSVWLNGENRGLRYGGS